MSPNDAARDLESIARDIDLVVFALERQAPTHTTDLLSERRRLLKELESLRDRVEDIARMLG